MPKGIHIGCCGWSYLIENEFADKLKRAYSSKLQAYAQLFDTVEINSTFYRLPRLTTAQKWRAEADAINPKFEFTVKAYQGITHRYRFKKESFELFDRLKIICKALNARIILFQSPASFKPTAATVKAMQLFFEKIDRDGLVCVWEPRGRWYEDQLTIYDVCELCGLAHCVDPFRHETLVFGGAKIAYFRLHGFGKPSMYQYDFSDDELERLKDTIDDLPRSVRNVYVLFNNAACYKNGLAFANTVPYE